MAARNRRRVSSLSSLFWLGVLTASAELLEKPAMPTRLARLSNVLVASNWKRGPIRGRNDTPTMRRRQALVATPRFAASGTPTFVPTAAAEAGLRWQDHLARPKSLMCGEGSGKKRKQSEREERPWPQSKGGRVASLQHVRPSSCRCGSF
eukprot:scaffold149_cov315-Pinguiococcus_pyrenoidosus.AAC.117